MKYHDFGGYKLKFQTTSTLYTGSVDNFLLSANVGKTTVDLSTKGSSVDTRGSIILETAPLVDEEGTVIGRQWSGCVPGHGSLTGNDELFLRRSLNVSNFLKSEFMNADKSFAS